MSATNGSAGKSKGLETAQQFHLVSFQLDQQMYALPIEPIQQIIEMVTITPVPQVNHSVEGVINFRGKAIPVVNLRKHLGMPKIPLGLHTPIILIMFGEYLVGLLVDEVKAVLTCPASDVVSPRAVLPDGLGDTPLLKGLLRTGDELVLLLDVEHLFQAGHAQALVEAVTAIPDVAESVTAPKPEASQPNASKTKRKPSRSKPAAKSPAKSTDEATA